MVSLKPEYLEYVSVCTDIPEYLEYVSVYLVCLYTQSYRIAGKFGGELNLAVWRYALKPPN